MGEPSTWVIVEAELEVSQAKLRVAEADLEVKEAKLRLEKFESDPNRLIAGYKNINI